MLKKSIPIVVGVVASSVITLITFSPSTTYWVGFSPKGGCTEAIVDQINKAKSSIYVQAYSFTSKPIIQALAAQKTNNPNIVIEIIVDEDESSTTNKYACDTCIANKIPVFTDAKHPISHNKVIIIDGQTLITGSFNFTAQAENNAENLLIINDKVLAQKYMSNWLLHKAHSVPYTIKVNNNKIDHNNNK